MHIFNIYLETAPPGYKFEEHKKEWVYIETDIILLMSGGCIFVKYTMVSDLKYFLLIDKNLNWWSGGAAKW